MPNDLPKGSSVMKWFVSMVRCGDGTLYTGTFRFADDRIIPRFHLEGVEAGRQVSVFKINPDTGERLGLLAMATVGEGGWVDLGQPIIVKAGDMFVAVPE
jgi:hypothetical protein